MFFLVSCVSRPTNQLEKTIDTSHSKKQSSKITLAFVGDIILHQRLRQREEKTKEGFSTIWQELQPSFDSVDILYGNLEGPVAHELGGVSGYPRFNFPESILPELKKSGFDVVSTANNHSLDRGSKGIDITIQKLNRYGLNYTGTLNSNALTVPFYTLVPLKDSANRFIAFLACTEMLNGHLDRKKQVLLCYEQNELILQTVRELSQREDVLAVVVTPHWGEENIFEASARQKSWARAVIESGAKAVVGSHSHVIGEVENYKNGVILYSLGNFISNQPAAMNKLSLVFYLQMDSENSALEARVLPIYMQRTPQVDGTSLFRVVPVWEWSGVELQKLQKKWQQLIPESVTITSRESWLEFTTDRRQ